MAGHDIIEFLTLPKRSGTGVGGDNVEESPFSWCILKIDPSSLEIHAQCKYRTLCGNWTNHAFKGH